MTRTACVAAITTALVLSSGRPATAEDPAWERVAVGPGQLAVPKGWRTLDGVQPRMVLFRLGNGVAVPVTDETQAPLQVGLTVEKLPATTGSAGDVMSRLVKDAKQAPRLELAGVETVEDLTLGDGTRAKLLTAEFVKEGSRRSLQMKLVVVASGTPWVVSGYLVGGKKSTWPTPDSRYAKWMRGHLTSFTLDPAKFDEKAITATYMEFNRELAGK